eukprot:scaffold34002_cov65-Phaeocystis_antarctica.AAC.6
MPNSKNSAWIRLRLRLRLRLMVRLRGSGLGLGLGARKAPPGCFGCSSSGPRTPWRWGRRQARRAARARRAPARAAGTGCTAARQSSAGASSSSGRHSPGRTCKGRRPHAPSSAPASSFSAPPFLPAPRTGACTAASSSPRGRLLRKTARRRWRLPLRHPEAAAAPPWPAT